MVFLFVHENILCVLIKMLLMYISGYSSYLELCILAESKIIYMVLKLTDRIFSIYNFQIQH